MMIMLIPVLVMIVGMMVYLGSTNPKASEIGRIMFFAGMLWLVWLFANKTVKFP